MNFILIEAFICLIEFKVPGKDSQTVVCCSGKNSLRNLEDSEPD